jgi:hypothetical protein
MAGIPTDYSGGTYARRFNGSTLAPIGGLFYPSPNGVNEDQGVVYQTHTGMFLAQWFRGGGAGYIDTRLIGTDGSMSALDLGRGIGPGSGTNAIAFNPGTLTSLLVTKRAPDTALVAIELGDDGYPVNLTNTVVITPWDGQVPDYWPNIAVNAADRQWLVTAVLSGGAMGRFVQATDEWVSNGTFSAGMSGWSTFGQPSAGDFVASVSGGVLTFYRQPSSTQGVVFQSLGEVVAAGSTVTATFDLGNSSSVRKRVTILLHDSDFSDLQICTFWLGPNAPLRPYRINTHANQAWDNATISFYAASTGSNGGAYLLDNVSVYPTTGAPADRTECFDPTTPGPQSFPDSSNILTNGNFAAGLAPWGTFGQITHQIQGGVLEFVRPAGTPGGVVLQATGIGLPLHTRMTLTLRLGNSSGVRKRVTVLVHDNDFSDLAACTFWLSAGQSLATHTLKLFTSKAWTNTTVAVYPSTVDTTPWIRMDDANLRITMNAPMVGTECIETASGGGETIPGFSSAPDDRRSRSRPTPDGDAAGPETWQFDALETGVQSRLLPEPIDLTHASAPVLRFDSRLSEGLSQAFVEVTRDGIAWERVLSIPPSEDWTGVSVDLSDFAGDVVYVRFVYAGVTAGGAPVETWAIRGVSVEDRSPRRAGPAHR